MFTSNKIRFKLYERHHPMFPPAWKICKNKGQSISRNCLLAAWAPMAFFATVIGHTYTHHKIINSIDSQRKKRVFNVFDVIMVSNQMMNNAYQHLLLSNSTLVLRYWELWTHCLHLPGQNKTITSTINNWGSIPIFSETHLYLPAFQAASK